VTVWNDWNAKDIGLSGNVNESIASNRNAQRRKSWTNVSERMSDGPRRPREVPVVVLRWLKTMTDRQ
jgi:hypothetical protein